MKIIKKISMGLLAIALIFTTVGSYTAEAATNYTFKDVSKTSAAYKHVNAVVNTKALTTYSGGLFKPSNNVTKEAASAAVGKHSNVSLTNLTNPKFTDVSSKTSNYNYIAALNKKGAFATKTKQKFYPTNNISRMEFARLIVEAYDIPLKGKKAYADVASTNSYNPYVATVVQYGIMDLSNSKKNQFSPNGKVNRLQVAISMDKAKTVKYDIDQSVTVTKKDVVGTIGKDAGVSVKGVKNPNFKDVNSKTTNYNYIAALNSKGAFLTKSGQAFYPNNKISRGEYARLVVEAYDIPLYKKTTYKDVPTSNSYNVYVATVIHYGIMDFSNSKTKEFGLSKQVSKKQVTFSNNKAKAVQAKIIADKKKPAVPVTKPGSPVTEPKPPVTNPKPPVTNPEPPVTNPEPPVTNPEPPVTNPDPIGEVPTEYISSNATFVEGLLQQVNNERAILGVTPLVLDTNVSYAASFKAKDMANYDHLDHESATIGHYDNTLLRFGVQFTRSGEALTKFYNSGSHDSNVAVSTYSYFTSQPHYELLVSSTFTKVGIGYQLSTSTGNYYVSVMLVK